MTLLIIIDLGNFKNAGFQYRQCLEFLDEMTEMGIQKNVIIFGAAMSCMEKCSRADIGFQLMKRMKEEGIAPNVHIYNSAISACARSNLWEKGYELYEEMETFGVKRDVVTYNAGTNDNTYLSKTFDFRSDRGCFSFHYLLLFTVLDAVSSQIRLGRMLFEVGVERGFYAKVSRLGEQWFELDLHFLSLGGGEIALGWWFEECLVPYLTDTEKLATVKSISIVTGYGKTRTRGRRHGDDGMRKRCKAMLEFMNIKEHEQPNLGRIHVNKESLIEEVKKKGGRVIFDLDGYLHWKETETTANVIPDTEQKIRARFKPTVPGSCRPPFTRVENESTTEEYLLENQRVRLAKIRDLDALEEGDYRADIDYGLRDNIHFGQGTEDQVRRPETAMSDGGRNDRGFQRDDSRRSGGDRFGHYGPPGGSVEPQDSARRGFDEPRVHCNDEHGLRHNEQTSVVNQLRGPDDGGFDRSGLSNNGFRQEERNRGFDQARRPYDSPVVRNNAPSNFSHDIRRQDDRGRVFEQPRRQVEAPSLVNGPPNGFRQDQDIRGRGFEQPSRPVELPFNSTGAAKDFRQDDRDRGFEQARRPNEAFFDRNGPSIGGRSDDPGRYEHPRRPAEACFDRNGPPIGGRHDDRGRGFDQPGQYKSVGEATRYNDERYDGRPNDRVGGPIGHYGPASDHPMNDGPPRRDRGGIQSRVFGGPDQGDFQRNGDRDGRFPNDLPGRSPGPRMPFNPDNDRRFSEGLPPRREFEPNGFRQNNERKRPFNEEPTPRRESEFRGYPSYPNEPERRLSSRSRGYELDPQPQRTRLSSIVLEDRKRE